MKRQEVGVEVQKIIREAKFTAEQWGPLAGKSPDLIRQWAAGKQTPVDENLEALAVGLERHSRQAVELAARLRALKEGTGGAGAD